MKGEMFITLMIIGAAASGLMNGIVTKSVVKGIVTAVIIGFATFCFGFTGISAWNNSQAAIVTKVSIFPILSIAADLIVAIIKKNPRT